MTRQHSKRKVLVTDRPPAYLFLLLLFEVPGHHGFLSFGIRGLQTEGSHLLAAGHLSERLCRTVE